MFFRMVYKSGQIFLPFCHNSRVWQTDGRTDRRTDRNLITIPRLHYMQRGKNRLRLAKVIVKNKMSRFYGSVYIYNFIHHQTMIANSEKNKQIKIIKN